MDRPSPLPPPAADFEAVHVREHHVEDDQVRVAGLGLPERVLAVDRGAHRAAVKFQCHLDELTDVRLVVHDEHPGDTVVSWHGAPGSLVA